MLIKGSIDADFDVVFN